MIDKSIAVIIPAYNESEYIEGALAEITDFLSKTFQRYEVIVVDDGSADNTSEVACKFSERDPNVKVFRNDANSGKGASVRKGMLAAQADYVLFSDADMSTPMEEILKLLVAMHEGADVAIGSRALRRSEIIKKQNIIRRNMGRIFNFLIQFFLFKGIHDTQCGFKCFKGEIVQKIFGRQRINGFCFDVEILFVAKKLGHVVAEIPVRWINREASRVAVIRDSTRMFWDIFVIKANWARGLYEIK